MRSASGSDFLDRDPGTCVLLHHHHHEETQEPLVWAVEQDPTRAVHDALGHDVRSYGSPERVDFLRREVRWLRDLQRPTS